MIFSLPVTMIFYHAGLCWANLFAGIDILGEKQFKYFYPIRTLRGGTQPKVLELCEIACRCEESFVGENAGAV